MLLELMVLLGGCDVQPLTEARDEASTRDGGLADESDLPVPTPVRAPSPRLAPPSLAPAFSLPDAVTGQLWSLRATLDPKGSSCPKAVLLAFLAANCSPCQDSLAVLRELELANPELELVLVLVDPDPEQREVELRQIRDAGIDGRALVADEATVATWGRDGKVAPLYVYIDRNGRLTSRNEKFDDMVRRWLPQQAVKALK